MVYVEAVAYGANNTFKRIEETRVLAELSMAIVRREKFHITNESMGGDPVPGHRKHAEIKWRNNAGTKTYWLGAKEGEYFDFSEAEVETTVEIVGVLCNHQMVRDDVVHQKLRQAIATKGKFHVIPKNIGMPDDYKGTCHVRWRERPGSEVLQTGTWMMGDEFDFSKDDHYRPPPDEAW